MVQPDVTELSMLITLRAWSIALATLMMICSPAAAQSRHGGFGAGFHAGHHHHHHGGWGVGFWGFGWAPGYVVVAPRVEAWPGADAQPMVAMPPDPVFTPRNGQDAAQTEADRQACNRWATTQPDAMSNARTFHQMTLGCMESRGYSVRQ